MKKIFLIRHAKSDWSIEGQPDIDRPLNNRGYTDAHLMGVHLKNLFSGSILFVSSPAIRAISTALIIARETGYGEENILIDRNLYEAEVHDYIKIIQSIDERFDTLCMFGHNPTISEVAEKLSTQIIPELPTCSVFIIEFEAKKWREIAGTKGKISGQIFPAHLKNN